MFKVQIARLQLSTHSSRNKRHEVKLELVSKDVLKCPVRYQRCQTVLDAVQAACTSSQDVKFFPKSVR